MDQNTMSNPLNGTMGRWDVVTKIQERLNSKTLPVASETATR